MLVTYALLWIPLILVGIGNGIVREATYGKRLAELRAHQLSTAILIALVGTYVWLVALRWPLDSAGQALAVGLMWLALTVAFEFLFGRSVAGYSWQRLLRDYDLTAGRVWSLFLLFTAVAPWLVYHLQR